MTQHDDSLGFSELTPDIIIGAAESRGIECSGHLLALNSYENRVYQVGVADGTYLVGKFYRPNRWSDDAILEEHDFAAMLAGLEIPVVAPLEFDGETLLHFDEFRFALYPRRGGRAPELDDFATLEQLGRFVARIHLAGERERFRERPTLTVDRLGHASRDWLMDNGFIPEDLEPAYASLSADVLDMARDCFRRCAGIATIRLHGDLHPGNVLVAGERLHIVDLDDAMNGPAVQDIWMFLSGDEGEWRPQFDAIMRGYESFRDFDYGELGLVEALRALRLIHYAAWLGRRWADPAFKHAFPWFDTPRYWSEHVLALREQFAAMQDPERYAAVSRANR